MTSKNSSLTIEQSVYIGYGTDFAGPSNAAAQRIPAQKASMKKTVKKRLSQNFSFWESYFAFSEAFPKTNRVLGKAQMLKFS
jgi:hypothetical protein